MKALVTGCAGFIGSHLVDKKSAEGVGMKNRVQFKRGLLGSWWRGLSEKLI